jgi:hypothetical protein
MIYVLVDPSVLKPFDSVIPQNVIFKSQKSILRGICSCKCLLRQNKLLAGLGQNVPDGTCYNGYITIEISFVNLSIFAKKEVPFGIYNIRCCEDTDVFDVLFGLKEKTVL